MGLGLVLAPLALAASAAEQGNATAAACPGTAGCGCGWTKGGANCGKDDGSKCFCECCCPHKPAGFSCKWHGGPTPSPSPPAPPSPPSPPPPPAPPPPPPGPPGSCTTDQALTITENGVPKTVWVKSAGKTNRGIDVSGGNLTVEHGPRAYLISECTESVTPSTFSRSALLWNASKTLSYTVDLSKVGCACNAALYLVAMPYHDKDTCGDYYCDASFPHCHCPEMDIQEANNHGESSSGCQPRLVTQ